MRLKMAVFAPIPRARTMTAAAVKPRAFTNCRRANLKSWSIIV